MPLQSHPYKVTKGNGNKHSEIKKAAGAALFYLRDLYRLAAFFLAGLLYCFLVF